MTSQDRVVRARMFTDDEEDDPEVARRRVRRRIVIWTISRKLRAIWNVAPKRGPRAYRLSMTNLPNVTPRSTPLPVPANAKETVPLVTTCAADDSTAPAWTSIEA